MKNQTLIVEIVVWHINIRFFALFAYFWWILFCPYWQMEKDINSCPSDFLLRVMSGNVVFLLILCLSLF